MNKAQLKKFKTLLEEKRDEIVKKAKQTLDEDMTLDANDLPDEMDLASSEYLQSFTFRLRGREKSFLDKIAEGARQDRGRLVRHLRGVRRRDLDQAPRSAPRDDALHPLQRGPGAHGKGLRLSASGALRRALAPLRPVRSGLRGVLAGARCGAIEHRAQVVAGVERFDSARLASGVPSATSSPPRSPPSGPRSMTQSAHATTSRLCSMTTTVLPASRRLDERGREHLDVREVQARRRLVEHVERAARGLARELARELHALRFAARERRRRLAERDVPEADARRARRAARARAGCVSNMLDRLLDREVERVGDRQAAVPHLERLAVVAPPAARLARDEDVGQKVHLDAEHAVALARLAAAALHVEREAPGLVAARARLGQTRRRARASSEKTPVYVAGFERGVRPMGAWSMRDRPCRCARALRSPSHAPTGAGRAVELARAPRAAACRR